MNSLQRSDTYRSNGDTDRRVWTFQRVDEHRWIARTSDVEGNVEAKQYGHVFHMNYPLEVRVDGRDITFTMDDWMYLQPDGRLINRTSMSKLGVTLGEVTLSFDKAP